MVMKVSYSPRGGFRRVMFRSVESSRGMVSGWYVLPVRVWTVYRRPAVAVGSPVAGG